MSDSSDYIGRFAPSPTGPLHAGSLLTAVASFLHARQHDGQWRLRIDNLDTPRLTPGSETDILAALELHGLHWDGEIVRQSDRIELYRHQLERLGAQGLLFYCTCSRRSLQAHAAYPGTCHSRRTDIDQAPTAIRVFCGTRNVEFLDRVSGLQTTNLLDQGGDFIVWRRDGIAGYHLATAVDDSLSGITQVIRGNDLLGETARQIFLMQQLQGQVPEYGHLPVLVDAQGTKLSKQAGALPLDNSIPSDNLWYCLQQLELVPPTELCGAPVVELLAWAIDNWRLQPRPADAQVLQLPTT